MRDATRLWSLLAAASLAVSAAAADSGTMSIQVKQGAVRETPSFTGRVVGTLAYGDQVQALEKKPGWVRISAGSTAGWVSESALSKKRIVLTAGTETAHTGASSEELALAGKGFNSDVEAEFKSKTGNVDFAAVDRMEKRVVSQPEKTRFLREGGIR